MNQQSNFTIEVAVLRRGPYKDLRHHKHALGLYKNPRKDPEPCNLAKSGEADGAPGRVGAQGGGHAHLGLACARSWDGRTPDGRAR
jgi:hypothetical protein